MKKVFFIKEPSGKWNFSLCYNKTKILSSHGQGYSRCKDAVKSFNKNCKPVKQFKVTRAEFNALMK